MMLDDLIGLSIRFKPFKINGEEVQLFKLDDLMKANEHYAIRVNQLLGKEFYHKINDLVVGFTDKGSIRLMAHKDDDSNYLIVQCFDKEVLKTIEYKITELVVLGYA